MDIMEDDKSDADHEAQIHEFYDNLDRLSYLFI